MKNKVKKQNVHQKKQYAIFGLGVFGSTVAETLEEYGCEVLAVDQNMAHVERISKKVTKAVMADVTSKEELLALDIGDVDVVVVSLRNHLENAVLSIMLLKELGVPYVIAKARNHLHQDILEKVGADKVLRAEKEMGERIARSLLHKSIVDIAALDDRYTVSHIEAPAAWCGKTVVQLNVRHTYNMNLLGIKYGGQGDLSLNIDTAYKIKAGDTFLVIAKVEDIEAFDLLH